MISERVGDRSMTSLPFHALVYYSYQTENDSVVVSAFSLSVITFSVTLIFHKRFYIVHLQIITWKYAYFVVAESENKDGRKP